MLPLLYGPAAADWVRDGLNLRLDIGICSVDDAITTTTDTKTDGDDEGWGHDDQEQQEKEQDCQGAPAAAAAAGLGDGSKKKRRKQECRPHHGQQEQEQQQQNGCSLATTMAATAATTATTAAAGESAGVSITPTSCPPSPPSPSRLEIVAASAMPKGCEVFNTYGELSNPELVRKYGFCLPLNPFDEVALGGSWEEAVNGVWGEMQGRGGMRGGQRELRRRLRWIKNQQG